MTEYTDDGDCGSWVCDLRTGAVYGHIVSGYTNTGSAYLIPSDQIFQDMQKALGKPVQLLTRSLAARNAALSIWGHIDTDTSQSITSGTQQSTSPLLRTSIHSRPEAVYSEPLAVLEKPAHTLAKALKARPAFVEDADDEGHVIPNTKMIASRTETNNPTYPSVKTSSKSKDITSGPGYSSERHISSDRSSSAIRRDFLTVESSEQISGPSPRAMAPSRSIKQERVAEKKKDPKNHRHRQSQAVIKSPRRNGKPSAPKPSRLHPKPANSNESLNASHFRIMPSSQGMASSIHPTPTQPSYFDPRTTPVTIPQSIPLRPQVSSTMVPRPMSYYGTMNSGYASGLPSATAPPFPPPQTFVAQPLYPHSSSIPYQHLGSNPGQYQFLPQILTESSSPNAGQSPGRFSPQSRFLSSRLAPSVQVTRRTRSSSNDSDHEYISASELRDQQDMSVPPRPKSTTGTTSGSTHPPLNRTGSQVEMRDHLAISPPVSSPLGQQRTQYDISYPQRPQVTRGSVSYGIAGRPGVHIEPAVSRSRRERRSSLSSAQQPAHDTDLDQKLSQAAAYQKDIAGSSSAYFASEIVKRPHGRQALIVNRDTRSIRSSADTQSTRSSHDTRSRSPSTSSASSVTSRDEISYKKPASTRARDNSDNKEDVTIKISRGGQVTVGGTQIDCNDKGEIVINRARSVLDSQPSEDRVSYDYTETERLRKRFDRSTSATEDGKSNLSMRSAASDDTVKGKEKAKLASPDGQRTPSISTIGVQTTSAKHGKDGVNKKLPTRTVSEIAAESAAKDRDTATKRIPRTMGMRCGTCSIVGFDVWVIPGKVCPVCGTPC